MTDDSLTDEGKPARGGNAPDDAPSAHSADMSVWLIWGAIMLVAVAVLPFAVRSQDVVRAIANMCGFDLG